VNKEQIYDSKISPLMLQIIEICQAEGIAMLSSFAIGHGDGGPEGEDATDLVCTSLTPDGDGNSYPKFQHCARVIRGGGFAIAGLMITTQREGGTSEMTAVT